MEQNTQPLQQAQTWEAERAGEKGVWIQRPVHPTLMATGSPQW